MKRLVFILFIIHSSLFINKSFAQKNYPFPDSNAVWSYSIAHHYYPPTGYDVDTYFYALFDQDTIINTQKYYKLYQNMSFSDSTIKISSHYTEYVGALRKVDSIKKVYFIPKNSIKEYLIYDFNININDTFNIQTYKGNTKVFCRKIDSVLIQNQYRKIYTIHFYYSMGFETDWIEGIGSTKDLLDSYNPELTQGEFSLKLLCFKINNNFGVVYSCIKHFLHKS